MYKNKLLLTGNATYMRCNRVGLAVVHTTVLELKSPSDTMAKKRTNLYLVLKPVFSSSPL